MNQTIRVYNESILYEQIPDVSVAIGLNPPEHCKFATIQAEGGDVRYRSDGNDPTSAEGTVLFDGQILEFYGKLLDIKFVDVLAPSKLNVEYFKTR